jgi:hypothetical protein
MQKEKPLDHLDIDDYGSVIPIKELELNIRPYYDSIIQTLKRSHAAVFTVGNIDDNNNSTIILASGMTIDDLDREKNK